MLLSRRSLHAYNFKWIVTLAIFKPFHLPTLKAKTYDWLWAVCFSLTETKKSMKSFSKTFQHVICTDAELGVLSAVSPRPKIPCPNHLWWCFPPRNFNQSVWNAQAYTNSNRHIYMCVVQHWTTHKRQATHTTINERCGCVCVWTTKIIQSNIFIDMIIYRKRLSATTVLNYVHVVPWTSRPLLFSFVVPR